MDLDVDLVILAGGRSSRMGSDKLLLARDGRLLLSEWIDKIAWPGTPLLILPPGAGVPTQLSSLRIAHDAAADQGPLQGVLTAMCHRESNWQIVVPIDMPNLERAHLDELISQTTSDPTACAGMYRRTIGKICAIEPFPLMIHADLQSAVEMRLASGRRSLHGLADEPATRVFDSPVVWPTSTWLNLNKPHDLQQFLRG